MDGISFNRLNLNEDQHDMDENFPVEEEFDEIELPSVVKHVDNMSTPENYINIKCFFCLQDTRFKKDGCFTHYPTMGDTQKATLNSMVNDSKISGTFKTTGAIQIADWFNSKIVSVLNSLASRSVEKYNNVSALDVITHFSEHIETPDIVVDQTIEQLHLVTTDIFKKCGILKQSKTKVSKKTNELIIEPNEKNIKTWATLLKIKSDYLKIKLTSNTIKK